MRNRDGRGWTRTARPESVVTTAMFDGIIDDTRRQRCRERRTLKRQRSLASSLVLGVEWLGAARVVQLTIVENRVSVVLLSQPVSDRDRRHPGPDCSIWDRRTTYASASIWGSSRAVSGAASGRGLEVSAMLFGVKLSVVLIRKSKN